MANSLRELILVTVVVSAVLAPDVARAELPSPYGETTGFVISGGVGVNGVTDDDWVDDIWLGDVDVGAIVGLELRFAYRPIDYLSVGLSAHFGFLDIEGENMNQELGSLLGILAEVRGHLPMSRFDPFVGFGFGYAMAHAKAEDLGGFNENRYALTLHGVGISVAAGLDVAITQRFSLGVYFRMIFGAYLTACWDYEDIPIFGSDDDCDDIEDYYNVDDRDDLPGLPHLWVIGITASYII